MSKAGTPADGIEFNQVMQEIMGDIASTHFSEAHHRATYILFDDLIKLPELPKRVRLEESKDYGMIHIYHIIDGRVPALDPGFYRTIHNGRIHVIEIGRRQANGHSQTAWMYRPKVRVRANR